MVCDHALPGARKALRKREPLGVGTIGQENRPFPCRLRPEYVRTHHQAVVHDDPDAPLDENIVLLDCLSLYLPSFSFLRRTTTVRFSILFIKRKIPTN